MTRFAWAALCAVILLTTGACNGPPSATSASASDAAPATRLETLLTSPQDARFAQALAPRPFEFPRDHGPHPGFRHEWWYVTGHLDAVSGERFGFELTFFRYALAPGSEPPPQASAWRASQVYVAHFAITDVSGRRFYFAERRDRDALELAGAKAEPLRVWVQDWTLESNGSEWRLSAADASYALRLTLLPAGQPVLHGDAGLSRKSAAAGAASYYYSIPVLAAHGELVRGTERLDVRGTAWLDREWGSGALASDQEGWDWFALQFTDGSALMFYALRKRGGALDAFSAGSWIDSRGVRRPLASADVDIDVLEHWRSPRGDSYPARWRLRVPALGLDLDLVPVLADQELGTTPRYWEGAVDVKGIQGSQRTSGRGYVELTGYARSP